jgi:hypothetical protein
MSFPSSGSMIGKGRPGGAGGNKVAGDTGGDPIRKARPKSELGSGQSTGTKGNDRDPIRKSRPKGSGSGQSTATK